MPILAMADASGSCGDNVTWTYVSSTQTLTIQGSGAMTDYNDQFSTPWQNYRDYIKTLNINEGVTSIGSSSFAGFLGINNVTLPNSVTTIGDAAFSSCQNIESVNLSNSITIVGAGAFADCYSLTYVYIPNSVTSIKRGAFSGCTNLTSIYIGNGVTSIEETAFTGTSTLVSIRVASSNTKYDSRDNCNAIIESETNKLILGCNTTVIPNGITNIVDFAFRNCSNLSSINIPNSVKSIGRYAFSGCTNLTSIMIPNGVVTIEGYAFYGCANLTSIFIPNSVTAIGRSAFSFCPKIGTIDIEDDNPSYDSREDCNAIIETLTNKLVTGCKNTIIPNSVTSIGDNAFWGCTSLVSIVIPNSVTTIGDYAFANCSGLTSITIGNGITSIGEYAFDACSSLTKVIVPDISKWCSISFSDYRGNPLLYARHLYIDDNTEITELVIPDGVATVGNHLFRNCLSLTSITIPKSVISIGEGAFYNCVNLNSVTIGKSVTSIATEAFYHCTNLTSVTSKIESPFTYGSLAFYGISSSCVLTVPYGKSDDYIAAGWTSSIFKGGIVESDKVSIAMETGSGSPRTMIGYSSQNSLDFTSITDVKAYIAIGFTDTKNVILARTYVVPANTGIVLKTDDAGIEVDVPITTSNVYYANLLHPAVDNVTIQPSETIDDVDYTNMMVGTLTNGKMGFVTFSTPKAYSNKSYLRIPTEFYESAASAREGGMEVVFAESETTDNICLIRNNSISNDAYYDLQGRKVIPNKKGFYIRNGKKVLIK